jgi:hypothetical protein
MVQRTGRPAKLPFPGAPTMLRHSTGYKLASDGHDTRPLASLPRASQFTVDGAVHGIVAGSVQWVLDYTHRGREMKIYDELRKAVGFIGYVNQCNDAFIPVGSLFFLGHDDSEALRGVHLQPVYSPKE